MVDRPPFRTAPEGRGAASGRGNALAARLAVQAEVGAACSEKLARLLSESAARGDAERRMAIVDWERQVLEVERYNAGRLRSAERPLWLKHLPPVRWDPDPEPGG